MPSYRCCHDVFDITTKRTRKCKLHKHFRNYCYIHSTLIFYNTAEIIQKFWRGFYARKKLNNLFYNLPRELQFHVMKYVREDHYIEKKWIPSVVKIYKNRLSINKYIEKNLDLSYTNYMISELEYDSYSHQNNLSQDINRSMIATFTNY